MLLVGQRRFREAEEVVQNISERMSDPCPARGRLAWIHREQGQKQAAVEEMIAVLESAPWYQWGWNVLMGWLTEDQAWDRAKSLLSVIPPEIRTYPNLLRERLLLLTRAGLEEKDLDLEWSQLLSDFSEDAALHQERYDLLRDKKRLPEAAEVLRKIQPLNPDDPFMNARLVEVLARERKTEEALEALLRIFFAQVERSEWPANFAWHTVRLARMGDEAIERVDKSLKEGFRPTPQALTLWAYAVLETQSTQGQAPRSILHTWFPDKSSRKVLAILDGAAQAEWLDGRYRARLLACLCDFGYDGLVARYWKSHREHVESDVDSWAQTGRALIRLGRQREARELLATWNERPGVSMWMIANYVGCFSSVEAKSLREVRSLCKEALSTLPHDHNARYLAHVQAEAEALLGDEDGFRRIWKEQQGYFDGELSENEWFHSERLYLREEIPALAQYLETNQRSRYRRTLWRLRWKNARRELRSLALARTARKIPFAIWWLLFIMTSAFLANL